jgi:drug/metabolite transporter (DMT)-like permease
MNWRNALVLGGIFVIVGTIYLLVQGDGHTADRSGAAMLIVLGIAMAFAFSVLLRGSREL